MQAMPAILEFNDTIEAEVADDVRNRNAVRSVDRAASLLLAMGESDGPVGVSELALRLGLHKSTASRLLATLQERGLVEQNRGSGKYRLGLAVVRLGGHAEKMLDLRAIALPALESVSRAVKETSSLGELQGDSVVEVAWSDPSGRTHDPRLWSRPVHATASGKVLLSNLPEREVVRLSKIGFTPYTPNTIVRLDLLLEELSRVRKRGFATAFGENEACQNAVAVPVFDPRASVVAALEVRGSGSRLPFSRVPELVAGIRDAAALITERIGGVAFQ